MLMQIGSVMFEGNRGASLEGVSRKTTGNLAAKGLLSGLPGREWTGWDGDLTLRGSVLPFHLGGLSDVETLHGWCADGTAVPVIRGDGSFLGWFGIASVQDDQSSLSRSGVGYEVTWTVTLQRVDKPSGSSIDALISGVNTLIDELSAIGSAAISTVSSLFG